MRRLLVTPTVALVALVMVSTAAGDSSKPSYATKAVVSFKPLASKPIKLPNIPKITRQLMRADRNVAARQKVLSGHVVAFWENPSRTWLRAPRHEKCWEVPWQRSCTIARASYKLHLTLMVAAKQKLWHELPHTTDWTTAVKIAQRAYPGTYAWLMSCSGTEGGHGRWVPNKDGAPPGGWMQMYQSTFWRMWGLGSYDGAIDDLAERGFKWPASAASWYSPLGQALASGWGYTHGRRGEWHSSGCYIN